MREFEISTVVPWSLVHATRGHAINRGKSPKKTYPKERGSIQGRVPEIIFGTSLFLGLFFARCILALAIALALVLCICARAAAPKIQLPEFNAPVESEGDVPDLLMVY